MIARESPESQILQEQYEILKQLIADGLKNIISLQRKAAELARNKHQEKEIEKTFEMQVVKDWGRIFSSSFFCFEKLLTPNNRNKCEKVADKLSELIARDEYPDLHGWLLDLSIQLAKLVGEERVIHNIAYNKSLNADYVNALNNLTNTLNSFAAPLTVIAEASKQYLSVEQPFADKKEVKKNQWSPTIMR